MFTGKEISCEKEGDRGQKRVQSREMQCKVEVEEATDEQKVTGMLGGTVKWERREGHLE